MPNPAPHPFQPFRNDRNEAALSRDGGCPIIEPACKKGLTALLDEWEPLNEKFSEIDDPPPVSKHIF